MSGIDKIIQQIESDTAAACDSVIGTAQRKADAVIASAEKEAERIVAEGRDKTALHVADIKKRGDSAADLEEKRVMLAAKQRIISEMLRTALDEAKNLPADDYFALIEKMVAKYSLTEDGVILFGEKDQKRLPADYIGRLNRAAQGGITLADETAPIEAGFILRYGGVEQNCSFDAIFAGEAETLCDKAGRLLF